MRVLRLLIVMIAVSVLAVGSALAQATPPAAPPASQQPTPPATAPPAAAAKPEAPRPYPEGAKIAYIDIQAVASNSVEGKAATGKLQELEKKKLAEIGEKKKELEAAKR